MENIKLFWTTLDGTTNARWKVAVSRKFLQFGRKRPWHGFKDTVTTITRTITTSTTTESTSTFGQ